MRPQENRPRDREATPKTESSQEAGPLPPAISSALEQGSGTVRERLRRIEAHSPKQERYTLLGEIAEGGMGRVLRVWDEVLQRELAMKVATVSAGDDTDPDAQTNHDRRIARFIEEARVTGQLDHPGIVPVHEIALDSKGLLYFTMPLVRGRTLSEILALASSNSEGWTLHRAVDVLHKVCMTVAFAHSRGVIHRDLKPDNIMVGPFGEAYVVDWGLALIEGRDEKNSIVGTPAYMAPEQAENPREVGPRSDVYSLGAILYEALSGSVPHQKTIDAARGNSSIDQLIRTPPRSPDRIAADVPPELLAICHKAMSRSATERYASALELASDLQCWLEGRVVEAFATTPLERLRKWRKRNRPLALALEALVMLALVSVLVVMVLQRGKLREVSAKNRTIEEQVYSLNLLAANLHQRALEMNPARLRLEACPPELRGWEWDHLKLLSDASTATLRVPIEASILSVAVDDTGTLIAAGTDIGTIRVWNTSTHEELHVLRGHAEDVQALAFQPGSTLLATASEDGTVRLWDLEQGSELAVFRDHGGGVRSIAFSPDGRLLASGDIRGIVHIRSHLPNTAEDTTVDRRATFRIPGDFVSALVFDPDGEHLVVGTSSGYLRRWSVITKSLVREELPLGAAVRALAFDPGGEHLFAAYKHQIFDLHPRRLARLRTLSGHASLVTSLVVDRTGKRLLSGSSDGTLRLWNVESGHSSATYFGHLDEVNAVAFLPDGRHFTSGSEDHTCRIWSTASRAVQVLDAAEERVLSVAFSNDGRWLASSSDDNSIRIWDARNGDLVRTINTRERADHVAWTPEGMLVFSLDDSDLRIVDPANPESWRVVQGKNSVPVCIATDQRTGDLFARYSDGTVHLWAAGEDHPRITLQLPEDYSFTLAVHPDGRSFATGAEDGSVTIRSSATGETVRVLKGSAEWIQALAYGAGGRLLAAGTTERSIFIWSTETGRLLHEITGHGGLVTSLFFSDSGDRLFSGASDNTVRVWKPSTGEALLTLHGHTSGVVAVSFDSATHQVASASRDGTIRLWRTRSERDAEVLER